jgi:hypothetical protein
MSNSSQHALSAGLAHTDWTTADLWVAAAGVGGNISRGDVLDIIGGVRVPTQLEHDVLAATLNDFFTEHGQDHPVPYWRDLPAD